MNVRQADGNRETEPRWLVEKGAGGALEAPAVFSQKEGILERNICSLQARLFLCVLCLSSCPISLSLSSIMGRKFCLCSIQGKWVQSFAGPGGRKGRIPPGVILLHFLQMLSAPGTQSPASQWLRPLLPHSLGLNTLLSSWTCSSFKPKFRVLLQEGSGLGYVQGPEAALRHGDPGRTRAEAKS